MSGMTYSPLFIFRFFFLFSVYLFDNSLRLKLRWGLKKLLLKRKKPLPSFAIFFRFWLLLICFLFCSNILISLFYFSNIQFPSFFLYHIVPSYPFIALNSVLILSLIPPYSFTRFNSLLYSFSINADLKIYNKIDDSSII